MGGQVLVLGSRGDFYNTQPNKYINIRWAVLFTEALLKDDDSKEIKLL